MSRPFRSCCAFVILSCLATVAGAHSYSHINGNDWVITCNDGTEINFSGSETQVYNSVRSSCRGHEAAPADGTGLAGAQGTGSLATGNHNSVRSNKSTIAAPEPPASTTPLVRKEQAPREGQ